MASNYRNWGVIAVAAALVLVDSMKPVSLDDTAYIRFAEHIAAHPLAPYDFSLFWNQHPSSAMEVLCPPVLPYWLALGIALAGTNVVVLKLILFPFAWLLVGSIRALIERFAPWGGPRLTVILCLSPLVWPSLNLMLDLPALALALAGLNVFLAAAEEPAARRRWRSGAVAGIVIGVAMQTKYSVFTIAPVVVGIGFIRGRPWLAIVTALVAGGVFWAWEAFVWFQSGRSHFLVQAAAPEPEGDKMLLEALGYQLGGTLPFVLLLAARALGPGRQWVAAGAIALAYGAVISSVAQSAEGNEVWYAGFSVLALGLGGAAAALLVRAKQQKDPDAAVLGWWAVVELVGYFVLSPFPATRRVLGLAVVLTLIIGRWASRNPIPWPLVAASVALGAGWVVLDWRGAEADRAAVEKTDRVIRGTQSDARIWFVGHWGWQFYAERAGWRPVDPDRSELAAGDWLAVPDMRVHFEQQALVLRRGAATTVQRIAVGEDAVPVAVFPYFYGVPPPICPLAPPRMTVLLYRMNVAHTPLTPRR